MLVHFFAIPDPVRHVKLRYRYLVHVLGTKSLCSDVEMTVCPERERARTTPFPEKKPCLAAMYATGC